MRWEDKGGIVCVLKVVTHYQFNAVLLFPCCYYPAVTFHTQFSVSILCDCCLL